MTEVHNVHALLRYFASYGLQSKLSNASLKGLSSGLQKGLYRIVDFTIWLNKKFTLLFG